MGTPYGRAFGTLYTGTLAAAGVLFQLDLGDLNGVGVQVTSAGTSCTVNYEVSNDNVNWKALLGWDANASNTAALISTSGTGIFTFDTTGFKWFRARVATYTSGTVNAIALASEDAPNIRSIYGSQGVVVGTQVNGVSTSAQGFLVGGYDGTNYRNLKTDVNGNAGVIGWLTGGSAAGAGIPGFNIMGYDGSNYRQIKTNANGSLFLNSSEVASGSADSGAPMKVGGKVDTSFPTITTGQRTDWLFSTRGSGFVSLMDASSAVGATVSGLGDGQATSVGAVWVNSRGVLYNGATVDIARSMGGASTTGVGVAAVGVQATSNSTGLTPGKLISLATTNSNVAKASAGKLVSGTISNTTAAFKYLKLYNKATSPNVGVDTPVWTIPIPPNSTIGLGDFLGVFGMSFTAGVAFAFTGASADTDSTAVAVGDVIFNWQVA